MRLVVDFSTRCYLELCPVLCSCYHRYDEFSQAIGSEVVLALLGIWMTSLQSLMQTVHRLLDGLAILFYQNKRSMAQSKVLMTQLMGTLLPLMQELTVMYAQRPLSPVLGEHALALRQVVAFSVRCAVLVCELFPCSGLERISPTDFDQLSDFR